MLDRLLRSDSESQRSRPEGGKLAASSKPFIDALAAKTRETIVIGLTGKNGSGMTEVAEFLSSQKFRHLLIQPADSEEFELSEIREFRLAQRYLRENWVPFVEVSVTAAMMSFVLDVDDEEGKNLVYMFQFDGFDQAVELNTKIKECYESRYEEIKLEAIRRLVKVELSLGDDRMARNGDHVKKALLSKVNEVLPSSRPKFEALKSMWADARGKLSQRQFSDYSTVVMCFGILPALTEEVRSLLSKESVDLFSLVFQRIGNNLRAYGKVLPGSRDHMGCGLFELPKRVNDFCLVLRHYHQATMFADEENVCDRKWITNPVMIVINNFKNIFEAYYFRQRYSSFYLVAVTGERNYGVKRRTMRLGVDGEMDYVDLGENLSTAKSAFKKYRKLLSEREKGNCRSDDYASVGLDKIQYSFLEEVFRNDLLRKECYLGKVAPFILQDVMTCVENSDVFVTRNTEEKDVSCDEELVRALARLAVLVMHPALLKPTKVERCMQTAMSTKLNSGCLSRQVGAVVTDCEYNILSIGWNDVPCSVETCSRKNLYDIVKKYDRKAYSTYELSDPAFRKYIDEVNVRLRSDEVKNTLGGLPAAYCFKDIYQDLIGERDQVHTRALHAEERALAACGNEKAKGGYLFTTSSPCEACAKRIKEAGISKIYYIEQYPGISHDHVIDDGPYEGRAEFEFFTGIVGLAYTRLYTPLIPYKDELEAMGVSPKLLREGAETENRKMESSTQSECDEKPAGRSRRKQRAARFIDLFNRRFRERDGNAVKK